MDERGAGESGEGRVVCVKEGLDKRQLFKKPFIIDSPFQPI